MAIGCTSDAIDTGVAGQTFSLDTPVFINEIHYDNEGTDQDEAIEVAGPAGSDLSQYSLVLYNGNGGTVYDTLALSGTIVDEGSGYGAVSFSYPVNGIQNGSPDGIALVQGAELIQFLSYEGSFGAVGGPADGVTSTDIGVTEASSTAVGDSLQLTGTGTSYSDFTWTAPKAASFGSVNAGQAFSTAGGGSGGDSGSGGSGSGGAAQSDACGDAVTRISTVQGAGFVSPFENETVSIEGVVVGDFQGSGANLGGFFLQDTVSDFDPLSSEGVFVFDESLTTDVSLGDLVRVTGRVTEFYELTEIVAQRVTRCGTTALPAPTHVDLPYSDPIEFESVEGMLVGFDTLTVTETYDLGRYGEVLLSSGGRLFNPTNDSGATPSGNAHRKILLDDGRDAQNLEPVAYLGPDGTLRVGDQVAGLTAIMDYDFGVYRLQPVDRAAIQFERNNPRSNAPMDVGGDLKVGSLNVLNYFTTLGDRGADTPVELERQRAKLVSAVLAMDPDVLGLMEIQNGSDALDDFVASINARADKELYARAHDPDFLGSDAIRTAIIYKPSKLRLGVLTASDASPVFSRPPIAQEFSYQGNHFSVVVNHFKSKGSCPSDPSDENSDFGQGCWNALRVQQAQALLGFIEQLQSDTDDDDVIVLGDLNSYLGEDPIATLEEGGLINRIREIPVGTRYSYVFSGESGVLDYGMTTPEFGVDEATIWHINADEPHILDYNQEFNPAALYHPDEFRSSDHDPVLLGVQLPTDLPNWLSDWLDSFSREANAAGLSIGQRLRVTVQVELAQKALELAQRTSRLPRIIDSVTRGIARRNLTRVTGILDSFVSTGALSASSREALSDELSAILQAL